MFCLYLALYPLLSTDPVQDDKKIVSTVLNDKMSNQEGHRCYGAKHVIPHPPPPPTHTHYIYMLLAYFQKVLFLKVYLGSHPCIWDPTHALV